MRGRKKPTKWSAFVGSLRLLSIGEAAWMPRGYYWDCIIGPHVLKYYPWRVFVHFVRWQLWPGYQKRGSGAVQYTHTPSFTAAQGKAAAAHGHAYP
jgi:hypothetical protein